MRVVSVILGGIIAVLLAMPVALGSPTPSTPGAVTPSRPAMLDVEVRSVIEAYPGFSLALLADGTVATVEGQGRVLKTYEDYGIISLSGVRFDPALSTSRWHGPGAYFVQTIGPMKQEWRAEIENRGKILDYVPHFAFLVWYDVDPLPSLRSSPFVRAVASHGPQFKLAESIQPLIGVGGPEISVRIQVYDPASRVNGDHLASITNAEFDLAHSEESPNLPPYRLFKLDGVLPSDLGALAQRPDVIFIDLWEEPRVDDEVSTQIIAANIQANKAVLGYAAWLASLGLDGAGVMMGHSDTGVDIDHGDFEGRVSGPSATGSGGAHGTHTMSTILGAPVGGGKDTQGFLYGQGVAPKSTGYAVAISAGQSSIEEMSKAGAIGSSNSWNSGTSGGKNYGTNEREQDVFVIDADPSTAGDQPFAQIFSAGNSGASGLTRPHAAKNIVAVCASENGRTGNINSKASFSSVGYTADNRVKPEICAPGADVYSAQSGTTDQYVTMSGTSMSCPHVAGVTLLVFQWYKREYGTMPSPAMNKAMIVNGAMDMIGGNAADIPNTYEGWGRVNMNDTFAKSRGVAMTHIDNKDIATGQEHTITASAKDPGLPLRVTLAWTDVPGASGANPALVNDIDLVVDGAGGPYNGNVFNGSWSVSGGQPSQIDNLENVFLQNPSGSYTIRVKGANVAQGPQKYSLVVFNAGAASSGLKVDTPKGGESWKGGDQVSIAWSSTGALQANSIALSFSKDNGASWDPPFAQGQPTNGSSQWTVPVVDTTTGMLRAVAKDMGGADVEAQSGTFTVDSSPPVATARALPPLTSVAAFDVAFDANDTGSGVKDVEISYRVGGGAFSSAGKTATSPFKFTATKDGRHEFYASGTDNIGNVEAAPAAAEAFTLVDLAPPALVSSSPANNAVDVAPDTIVDLTFSEEMERATVESGITITPSATKGAYTWDATGVKVSFPLSKLALLTQYDVKVAGKDLAGRDLAATSVKFTTSKIPTNPAKLSGKVSDVFTTDPVAGVKVSATLGTLAWEALTDAAGAYVLDKLPAGALSLKATMSGYADGSASVTLSEGGSEVRDFVLTPPGAPYSLIRGKVVDEAGTAIEGAEVKVTGVTPVTTTADGKFELKVSKGTHSVGATKKGMTGDPTEVTVGDWEIKDVTLKMKPAPTFDLMSMNVAGIPLMWLLILLIAAIAVAAVASRARKRGGKCQWCSTSFKRGAAQCPNCGAPVATASQQSTPSGPPMQDTAPAPPPPPPYQPISSPPPAGDPSTWQPGPPPD